MVPDHVKQGVNITVEVLQRTLRAYEEAGKDLPSVLYLQADNTGKQNKSRSILSYEDKFSVEFGSMKLG